MSKDFERSDQRSDFEDPLTGKGKKKEIGQNSLLRNGYFWIIVIVCVLGILSHIFLPRQDASFSKAGQQAKNALSQLVNGNEEENNTKDSNGMSTLAGK